MATSFPSTVSPPGGANYAAPLMSFSGFQNWAADDPYKKIFDQQQQQLNQQRIAQGQTAIDIASTFKDGLPIDPRTGQIDYAKAVAMMAAKGDPNAIFAGADATMMQQAGNLSPLLSGGAQSAAPGGSAPAAAPASVPAAPMRAPAANSPRGDPGSGSITDLVTDRLPSQNQTTGETILKIAQVMGIDPNATMTPGQVRRAQGLLQRYAPEVAGTAPSFQDRFAASGDDSGGSLPPSAIAGSPAPRATPAPAGGGGPAQPQPAQPIPVQPGAAGAPAAPQGGPGGGPAPMQGGPIVPQVPLPKGFTDPQQAILALRAEAARLSTNPRAAGQANQLIDYAKRIEESITPLRVGPSDTYVNPANSQPIYQGPTAALMAGAATRGNSLQSDAEIYRQTGKLPANIGRGIQGNAESQAIREAARQQEIAEGGNPADWPSRWQNFATQATGKRVLEQRAVGLSLAENEASSLLPRVREASKKVSRTDYPTLNKLILAAEKGTGGEDVIKLGIAVQSLIPVYARVMKPVGQITEGDTHRASDILDKAWSDGQINAALDQMQIELKSARSALDKTIAESSDRGGSKTQGGQSQSGGASGARTGTRVTPNSINWSVEP
jgi:hypothetical protein